MFKDTKEFFEEVAAGRVTNIDIKRHVNTITDNHKLEYLKSLQYDISFFKFMYKEDLLAEITPKDWDEKFEYYKQKGKEIPTMKFPNMKRELKKKKGIPYDDEPEFILSYDEEKIFFPFDCFCINQLENYVETLIENHESPQPITPIKPNKSLLFEGSSLNLSERFKIANKILNIDKEIRKLNIKELEKYQLLAYILGCDKDNARNLMNGSYKSKDRDLSSYFNELGLKE
jgi:hypothetical protein